MNAKSKASATLVSAALLTGMGAVGSVEAHASTSAVDSLALEVVSQTWYSLPQAKQERYCDTRKPKRIVKKHHKGLGKQAKRELRKAYRIFLRDCQMPTDFSQSIYSTDFSYQWAVFPPNHLGVFVWADSEKNARHEARLQLDMGQLPNRTTVERITTA